MSAIDSQLFTWRQGVAADVLQYEVAADMVARPFYSKFHFMLKS